MAAEVLGRYGNPYVEAFLPSAGGAKLSVPIINLSTFKTTDERDAEGLRLLSSARPGKHS